MPSTQRFVIPPGQESLLARVFQPAGAGSGWRFIKLHVHQSEVKAAYARPGDGAPGSGPASGPIVAQVTLAHPSAPPPNPTLRTSRFAVAAVASRPHASFAPLVEELAARLRSSEEGFQWAEVQIGPPAPATRREPPRHMDRTGDPVGDPIGDRDDHGDGDGDPLDMRRQRRDEPPPAPDLGACMREADAHLELVPYIDLGADFDHAGCFEEAMRFRDSYRQHQSGTDGDLAPGWKSLALRAQGGKTDYSAETYGYRVEAAAETSRFTELAAHCPKTLAFLDTLVDIERASSVRYMLLEPGGEIPVHTDDLHRPVVHSINIALNMPPGCEFFMDLAPDGSPGPRMKQVPFRDGSAFLLNVAAYHRVIHRGDIPRMHLKIDGPLRMDAAALVERARAQNGVTGPALYRALRDKYQAMGWSLERSPHVKSEIAALGAA